MIQATITETPELRFTGSGIPVTTLSLFHSTLSPTEPVYAIAWNENAEIIGNDDAYFQPGATIKVEGYFKDRKWTSADGKEHSRREYVIQHIY